MKDLREAAEMALEALEWNYGTDLENIENCMAWLDKMNATIPALRQALAMKKFSEVNQEIEEALKQPQQEPVAWVYNGILHEFDPSEFATSEVKPLYTAPPQRTWVGLEDEDIATVKNEFNRGALWAEQVLKEKNT